MNAQEFLEQWRQLPYAKAFERQADFPIGMTPKAKTEILSRFYPSYPLLPIEFLKDYPDSIEAGFERPIAHSFLSSGTSQRDRSRSSFSWEGMNLYREFSLLSFRAMLANFFPVEPPSAGYSFIPNTKEWPSSSLAQMVEWIGQDFPLHYWNPTLALPRDQAVWLFATGFHIVSFADEGGFFPLPPGSIVIETGGTKGKTRSVTREECYSLIEQCFAVDRNHIVSEYGMCELASQAYDFVSEPNGRILALDERWFRFPVWAQTKILTADQTIAAAGDGSLVVDDRIRIDIGTPFRTEDRVRLGEDGAFQLQGRVAFSPLKGCSLLAEDILKTVPKGRLRPEDLRIKSSSLTSKAAPGRAAEIHHRTQFMLRDPNFRCLIQRSLGQDQLVSWWLEDLNASVPPSTEAWLAAADAAQNSCNSWLIIPPRTHEFAVMHPLFLAALLDLRVTVRPSLDRELLEYWQTLFKGFWNFAIVSSDWRLLPGDQPVAEGLLIYGSDETIKELQSATTARVHGFGTWLTLTLIKATSWMQDAWVKDAFSLKQAGCMSSRLLIVWDDERPSRLGARKATIGPLTHGDHLHLAHSELDLCCRGYSLLQRLSRDDLVLGHRAWAPADELESLLSPRPLTLPIIRASRKDLGAISKLIELNPSFQLVSADAESLDLLKAYPKIKTVAVGKANTAGWTGVHGGRPVFFPDEPT